MKGFAGMLILPLKKQYIMPRDELMSKAVRIGLDITPDAPYWVLVREAIYQSAEQDAIHLISIDVSNLIRAVFQRRCKWANRLPVC
jgi:hypothetical protein